MNIDLINVNSKSWGFHYAGDYSSGAGWLGPTCHGCDKGYSRWNEIGQPEIQVWVRKIDDAPAYCDGNGGCTTQVFCRSPAEKSTGGTCYFSKVSKLTPFSGLWASKCLRPIRLFFVSKFTTRVKMHE